MNKITQSNFNPSLEDLITIHEEYNSWKKTGVLPVKALSREYSYILHSNDSFMSLTTMYLRCYNLMAEKMLAEYYPVVNTMNTYCENNPGARECREYDC